MLCDKSGYCFRFDLYTGISKDQQTEKNTMHSRVPNKLTVGWEGKNHKFFDNLFNSVEFI